MKTNNKAKRTETIISTSVILMLIGFIYMFYLLNNVHETVQEKKQELSELNAEIIKNKDSLHYIDQRLQLKQVLLDSILKQIKESDDTVLQEKVKRDLEADQTLNYSLKTSILRTTAPGKIVYMQVKDQQTKEYLEEIDLLDTLTKNEYRAFGYDLQPEGADNTVRFFHPEDSSNAQLLKKKIEKATGIEVKEQYIKGFENKVPSQQLEVWLKKPQNDSVSNNTKY